MSRTRILVVDDDDTTRELLRGVLERSGHEVREASDGRAGLRDLYAAAPDLVILDVEMPELDGWQTLERIRDLSDVPVLMLTARQAELERVRGLKGGADDYVVKPFGQQELAARVQALLRRSGPREAEQQTYADALLKIDHAQRRTRLREECPPAHCGLPHGPLPARGPPRRVWRNTEGRPPPGVAHRGRVRLNIVRLRR